MNRLYLIAATACPFWVLELTFKVLGLAPPPWVGGFMAGALILMGLALIAEFFQRSGKPDKGHSLPCLLHEILNYSSALRGNALLMRSQAQTQAMSQPLDRIERITDKIECLARDMLEGSSITQVANSRIQSIDLVSLIQECIREYFPESGDAFRIEADPSGTYIEGDSSQLERVFLNLFRNALEAGAKTIRVHLSSRGSRHRILVEDDGPGCSEVQLSRMFQPMYTTKKDKGGTGLGLYMVRAIMKSHGGGIRGVSKNPGSDSQTGMIFCLEMRRSKDPVKRKSRWQATRTPNWKKPFENYPVAAKA